MADITDPQVIRFCNEEIRPLCDRYVTLYWWCKELIAIWDAQGLVNIVPNTADLVADGTDVSGRGRISGALAHAAVAQAQTLVGEMEANSNAILNAVLQLAINPRGARF